MVGEIDLLNVWIPEQMRPGDVFVLEKPFSSDADGDQYWAILACPKCGTLGIITRKQANGLIQVICGSIDCPAEFLINEGTIIPRKPS